MSSRGATFGIVFAVVYALAYLAAVDRNWALVTYHPELVQFEFGTQKAKEGPAMYWFGWLATAALIAAIAGWLAMLLPERATRLVKPALAWVVPVCAMLAFAWILKGLFLR